MSTIVTENLKRSSETASRSLRGVAAAWIDFNGITATVRNSENVSSLTDLGVGNFVANMSVSSDVSETTGSVNASGAAEASGFKDLLTELRHTTRTSAGTAVDSSASFSAYFGDLA